MRRSTVGHCFSFGFGMAVALTSLWVGKGDQPWEAAYAGLFTALVSEITCWLWRKVNRLLVNDGPILVLGKDGVTHSKSAKCRPSTRPGSPTFALRNMFVSDVSAAVRRY